MLHVTVGKTQVAVSVGFPAVVAALCYFDKTGSAAMCLYAALLHEAAHVVVLHLCGSYARTLTFGAFGMRMELPLLSYTAAATVAAAGPLCNLLFAALSACCGWRVSLLAHVALGLFNALPVYPLDGGQVLFCIAANTRGEHAAKTLCRFTSLAVIVPLFAAAWWLLWSTGYNVSLFLLCGYLVFLLFFGKKH